MSRRKNNTPFEDDDRVIADMSGIRSSRPAGAHPSIGQGSGPEEKNGYGNAWEPPPFSWRERIHYIGAALGAALLIGFAFMAGLGFVIWLITLYGMK